MKFLETLKANRGELIRLKYQLYWYQNKSWDNNPGRVCFVIDAVKVGSGLPHASALPTLPYAETVRTAAFTTNTVSALLLIDGSPKRVWVNKQSIELLTSESV